MNATLTVDKAGRVVIPKGLRDELHLEPGDELRLESDDGCMTLRPVRSKSPLRKEHGIWVFRNGKEISAASTDKAFRDLRGRADCEDRG